MICHCVLLRPKSSLASAEREALLDAMRRAFEGIPDIRRVRIGKRVTIGREYESQMTEHYEFLCVIELDDVAALRRYLNHPAHADLGARFFLSADAALVYDFDVVEPGRVRELL